MAECRTVFVIVMSAFPSLCLLSRVCVCVFFLGGRGGGILNNGKESKRTHYSVLDRR